MAEKLTFEARKAAISASAAAAKASAEEGKAELRAIQWKGGEILLPVATVALDHVLLNPHSHRIRGQMESLDRATTGIVETDPFGAESQNLIRKILSDTEGFEKIYNALKRDNQLEPGVITDAGVLVNANTRAVALGMLGAEYIRVTVLPSDATQKEINDIELKLQMEIDVKQAYTLTSQLLFIEDLINSGLPTESIGRQVHPELTDSAADRKKAKAFVDDEIRLLSIVRDVLTASGGELKFTDFDDKRQALIEIDQDYQSMKNSKPEEAARIRDAQLTGMLTGIDYRKLREIDKRLMDKYVKPAMMEDSLLAGHLDSLLSASPAGNSGTNTSDLPGLDLLDSDDEFTPAASGEINMRGLFELIASTPEDGTLVLSASEGAEPIARAALVTAVSGAFQIAIYNKALDEKAGDILQAPMSFLSDAARAIDKAREAYELVRNDKAFNTGAFDSAFGTLERAFDSLVDTREEELSAAILGDMGIE